MNVADESAWLHMLDEHAARPPSILITAAGVNHREPFATSSRDHWDDMWRTNVVGTMLGARALLPGMIEAGFGRMIFISSVGAHIGLSDRCGYSATKGAVEAFARSLATEVGKSDITVNCVAPGAIASDLTRSFFEQRPDILKGILDRVPGRRLGEAEELAGAFRFLLDSSYSQGSTVVVDGGWTVS